MIKIKIDEEFVCDGFKFVFHKVDGKLKFTNLGPSRGGKKDPTEEDCVAFFKSKGFPEKLGKEFYEYYAVNDWKDGKGTPVKNFKQKALSVWMKDDRKEKATASDDKFLV